MKLPRKESRCNVQRKVIIKNKEYEVLQVIKKRLEAQDLFLCVDSNGIKSCFQRQDVYPKERTYKYRWTRWSQEEVDAMKDEILNGKTDREIAEELNFARGIEPTISKLRNLRKEMRKNDEQRWA